MGRRITTLTAQKRNLQRINVYLDGEFAFGLARIVAAWLHVGAELSDEKIARLQAEDEQEAAYQQALKLIRYRPRTEAELRKNLNKHFVPPETIEAVIERLRSTGLVDDARFAQGWVENRAELRPRSRRALAFELSQRGVDAQTIAASLETIDEEEMAFQTALKRARRLQTLDWRSFRQKMTQYLSQRGFNYEVSSQAVTRAWEETHAHTHQSREEEGGDVS